MNTTINNNSLFSFCARNTEIKAAQKILHKITSEYPASSPYKISVYAKKHMKTIEDYGYSGRRLNVVRHILKNYLDSDLEYAKTLLSQIKKLQVMNCKENSELACLIAMVNGFKDFACACFAKRLPDGSFADMDHTVLLINQKVSKNKTRLDKYYVDFIPASSAFIPSKKSIVIDPTFGIVDYWNNAVLSYENIYPEVSRNNLFVAARDLILNKTSDIKKLKQFHPELLLNKEQLQTQPTTLDKIINYVLKQINQNI